MLPRETQRPTSATRVVLFLALAWLLWRAGLGLVALAADQRHYDGDWLARVLGSSEQQRIAATLAQSDRKLGLSRGYHAAIHGALVAHVPPGTTVLLDLREKPRKVQVMANLSALVFPRIFRRLGAGGAAGPDTRGIEHVLSFGAASQAEWEARFTPLVTGPDWTLWHRKGGEDGAR